MKFGAIFPQTEFGNDPAAIRDFAQTAEGLGYHHILAFDHVLGASTANRPGWKGYTHEDAFHEVFVLFGYLAAVTRQVELVTGVLILPQRQTTLVARQAAEVDVLSSGRLRLGVGIGWNPVEYEALNEDFHTRGTRIEEQIEVLRALWAEPIVTYHGKWHHIFEAGLNPLPVRRAIPVWMGGHAEPVLKRLARTADGWFPLRAPNDEARAMIDRLYGYMQAAGRSPQTLGIEVFIATGEGTAADWKLQADAWQKLGATHISVNTMRAGLRSPQEHIDRLRLMADILGIGSGQSAS